MKRLIPNVTSSAEDLRINVVATARNDNKATSRYSYNSPLVFCVGATTRAHEKLHKSNSETDVLYLAPGK